jgi:death-on-curing protein
MEVFLVLNGHELDAPVDEQERLVLRLADGSLGRDELIEWVRQHMRASR